MVARIAALLALLAVVAACGADSTTDADGRPSETVAPSADVERAPIDPDAPVDVLVAGFNDAGFDLLRTLPLEDDTVYSPLSIGRALLMARAAADDETGRAIDQAFGLPDGRRAHQAWNALDAALTASDGTAEALDGTSTPTVRLVGGLWPSTTTEPDQAWIDLLAVEHGAGVETIDTGAADEARARINAWVADQTNDLIPDLVPEGFIDDRTVLVLTDAVYFKAQWRSIFGKYGEVVEPFTRLDGSTIDVTYLVDRDQPGPRGRGDGFVGAELPYLGDDYALLLIVPDEGRFAELRHRLSSDLLAEVDAGFTTGPYELHLPEWETTTAIDLLPWLTDLGAAPGAYPGIGPGVFIDGAVHGADISVDEIGTEAAAGTAIGFEESAAADPEFVVAADKPYLYVVRHTPTGVVLFAGQVTDPTD